MTDPNAHAPERDPGRKKKKKKKRAPARWPLYAGLGGGGAIVVGLLVMVLLKYTGGGPPAKPVTAWDKYSPNDTEFSLEYPADWRAESYGIRGRHEGYIKGGSATITIKENVTGSLVGDIANAANRGQPVDDEHTPVAKVHQLRRPQDSSSHKEEPAVSVMTKLGKARRSAYTDGSRRGYRATVLLRQTALDIFCECRESDWETLRPAFEHVIESVGPGAG